MLNLVVSWLLRIMTFENEYQSHQTNACANCPGLSRNSRKSALWSFCIANLAVSWLSRVDTSPIQMVRVRIAPGGCPIRNSRKVSAVVILHIKFSSELTLRFVTWLWRIELTFQIRYGVATISRLLKIVRLFGEYRSLLQVFFAKETYNFKEPTNRSHPIPDFGELIPVQSKWCVFETHRAAAPLEILRNS